MGTTVTLPSSSTPQLQSAVHWILFDTAEPAGATGWVTPPPPAETTAWLAGVLERVARGDAALCLVDVDGIAQALGCWVRAEGQLFRHSASLRAISTHPSARGLGLGRAVTAALAEHARAAGLETLTPGARGNNHRALALDASLGLQEWGLLPDVIEVGDLRFDDVCMVLRLSRPDGLGLRGSTPGGPGS